MSENTLPKRRLRMLYAQGSPTTTYTLHLKQSELAKKLEISRQALNVHLRKLRDEGYIRTGRGFIDVTEKGLGMHAKIRSLMSPLNHKIVCGST